MAELKKNAGNKEAEILEGHLVMLEDPFMLAQMEEAIDNGSVAEAAVDSICTMFINMFSGVDDELTRQRASDVKDIRDSLLRILLGVKSVDISSVPKGSVLIAKDFTPSMTSQINREMFPQLSPRSAALRVTAQYSPVPWAYPPFCRSSMRLKKSRTAI